MKNAKYGSSLTDTQWEYLEPMLPKLAKRGRPRTDLRQVLNAIFYVVKGGLPWRYLPAGFPPWLTVYGIFQRWKRDHQWAALNDALRLLVGKLRANAASPPLRCWTAKASNPPDMAAKWGMMRANASRAASGICWWTPWVWCWAWS